MKILFFHDGKLPVLEYGGTERIIYWLAKELVKLGHQVTVISHPDSNLSPIGVTHIPYNGGDFRTLIPKESEILHLHCPSDYHFDLPVVQTIHGNGKIGEEFLQNSIFVSHSHAKNHGAEAFVYNGIDFDEYPYLGRKDNSYEKFLFLAKASWKVKNVGDAVKACKINNKNLYVAGGRVISLSKYIHSLGIINQSKKLELLKSVDALLFPVRWNEPFGIAIVEAMAMGLPVVGSPYGALKELINPECGHIVTNRGELIERVGNMGTFSRDYIRDFAFNKFNSVQMAKGYLAYYQRVINGEQINHQNPKWINEKAPEVLLDFR